MTLQNQVNSHFLFNTLNTVSRTALFEGAKQAVVLLKNTMVFRGEKIFYIFYIKILSA
ncbi:MAG: histidine kinase [Firmicutes bacterium]|nr:histidine kinase [Bacillota bacterium]